MRKTNLWLAGTTCLTLVACSSDGSSSSDTGLGVAPTTRVTEMSSQEDTDFCEGLVRFSERQASRIAIDVDACTIAAVFIAGSAEVCEQTRQSCEDASTMATEVETEDEEEDFTAAECNENLARVKADCGDVTVAQIEACMNSVLSIFDELNQVTCADAGESALNTLRDRFAAVGGSGSIGTVFPDCEPLNNCNVLEFEE